MPIIGITPTVIRAWHAKALRGTGGRISISQSYRLMRSVFNVAVQDGAILRNPCQIPGAGAQRSPERSIATAAQVAELVEATTPRFKAAVVLAAWRGLRRGEVCALRTEDVDLRAGVVRVCRNYVELLEEPTRFEKDPKSDAGKRTVTISPHVAPVLQHRAIEFAGANYFFVDRYGTRVRSNAAYQAFVRARKKVGVDISFSQPEAHGAEPRGRDRRKPRGPQEATRARLDCSRPAVHACVGGQRRTDRQGALRDGR